MAVDNSDFISSKQIKDTWIRRKKLTTFILLYHTMTDYESNERSTLAYLGCKYYAIANVRSMDNFECKDRGKSEQNRIIPTKR